MIETYDKKAIKVQSLNLSKKEKKKIKCHLKNLESIFCEDSKSQSSQQRNKNLHNKGQVQQKTYEWNHQQNLKFAAFLEVHIEDLKNKTRYLFREWANYAVEGNYRKLRDRLCVIYEKWSSQDIESYALSIRQRLHLNNEEMQLEKFRLREQKNALKKISSPRQLMRNGLGQFLEGQQSYKIPDHQVKFFFGPISQMFQPANLSFQLLQCSKNQSEKGERKYQILISMDIEFIGCNGKQLSDVEKDWIQNELSIEPSESDFIKWQVKNMEIEEKIYDSIQRQNEENQKIGQGDRYWTRNQKAKFLTFLWAYWEQLNFEKNIKKSMFRRISYFVGTKNQQACESKYRLLAQSKRTLEQIIRDEQKQYGIDSASVFEEGKKLREAARQEERFITEQIRDIRHLRDFEVDQIDELDDQTTPALVKALLKDITTVIFTQ